MKVVTPYEMRAIDNETIKSIGISGLVLMENAALKVYNEIQKSIGTIAKKSIGIFAGKGNNGGDAFAVARHLFNNDAIVSVFVLSSKENIEGEALENLNILVKMGIDVNEVLKEDDISFVGSILKDVDVIVDGIFGTGFKGKTDGIIKKVIEQINKSNAYKVSIDIPSGLEGQSGKVHGECVKANKTIALGLLKTGLVLHPGCEYAGEIAVADISIPQIVVNKLDIKVNTIDREYVKNIFPKRVENSNKGDYGKAYIVSGSKGMIGAGCLCGMSAFKVGTGLVYLGVPKSSANVYNTVVAEAVVDALEDGKDGYILKCNADKILDRMNRCDVSVIGPGLSANHDIVCLMEDILLKATKPLVLDADALNAISKNVEMLRALKVEAVITPHPGEMGRLMGISSKDVQENRLDVAREFASKWGVVTVLKGSRTIIASPNGNVYINETGNAGMATAGAGDVLAGMIGALIAQDTKPFEAAVAGVYLHGLAGDRVAYIKGYHGMVAGDILENIPYSIKDLLSTDVTKSK